MKKFVLMVAALCMTLAMAFGQAQTASARSTIDTEYHAQCYYNPGSADGAVCVSLKFSKNIIYNEGMNGIAVDISCSGPWDTSYALAVDGKALAVSNQNGTTFWSKGDGGSNLTRSPCLSSFDAGDAPHATSLSINYRFQAHFANGTTCVRVLGFQINRSGSVPVTVSGCA